MNSEGDPNLDWRDMRDWTMFYLCRCPHISVGSELRHSTSCSSKCCPQHNTSWHLHLGRKESHLTLPPRLLDSMFSTERNRQGLGETTKTQWRYTLDQIRTKYVMNLNERWSLWVTRVARQRGCGFDILPNGNCSFPETCQQAWQCYGKNVRSHLPNPDYGSENLRYVCNYWVFSHATRSKRCCNVNWKPLEELGVQVNSRCHEILWKLESIGMLYSLHSCLGF